MNGLLYPKKAATTAVNEYGDGAVTPKTFISGGTGSGTGTGPTVSSRVYPKGKARVVGTMNPQKVPISTIYVGGVD